MHFFSLYVLFFSFLLVYITYSSKPCFANADFQLPGFYNTSIFLQKLTKCSQYIKHFLYLNTFLLKNERLDEIQKKYYIKILSEYSEKSCAKWEIWKHILAVHSRKNKICIFHTLVVKIQVNLWFVLTIFLENSENYRG